jgi:hypothetical protein
MASSGLDHRQHPQILAVPFPSHGLTTPTKLDLRQAKFGSTWRPLPNDLVLTIIEGDDPHSSDMEISEDDRPLPSSAGSCLQTHPPPHQQARVTGSHVSAMEGDSDMEISDDDRPLPSRVNSCLKTHPTTHQEAYDFLSSLFQETGVEGVWHGEGTIDAEEAGVSPGARPVDPAGGALVETIPGVDPPRTSGEGGWPGDGPVDEAGAGVVTARVGVCPGTRPVEPEGAAGRPGGETGMRHGNGTVDEEADEVCPGARPPPLLPAPGAQISSERSRQRRNRRKREGWIARRAAKTADSFLT